MYENQPLDLEQPFYKAGVRALPQLWAALLWNSRNLCAKMPGNQVPDSSEKGAVEDQLLNFLAKRTF
jgi:hypothetical protein